MDKGWIKIHRSMLGWEWYDDINTKILWLHILIKANHRDKKWHGITVPRGTFITSYQKLSDETGLTYSQVRTSLNKLKVTHEVTVKVTVKYSMVSVCEYDTYQVKNDLKQQSKSQSKSQLDDSLVATTKNERTKEVKKYSDNITTIVETFYSLKSKNHKNAIKVTDSLIQKSCETIDRLNKIDEVPLDYIKEVINRSIYDEFWKDQIMSLSGLRKKKNDVMKFTTLANGVMKSTYSPETTRKLIGYRYKCAACGVEVVEREFKYKDAFDMYRCKGDGCQKEQLGKRGEKIAGYLLKFVEKVYKDVS